MTTIAANLEYMCSDTFSSTSCVGYQVTKILKVGKSVIGCAGPSYKCEQFLKWFSKGGRAPIFNHTDRFEGLLLDTTGLYVFHNDLVRERITIGYHAIGSGQQYAIGAMTARVRPERAVRIAAQYDPFTKLPLETLCLI